MLRDKTRQNIKIINSRRVPTTPSLAHGLTGVVKATAMTTETRDEDAQISTKILLRRRGPASFALLREFSYYSA